MDNHFSLSLPYIEPGKVYRYGGDGNNLAGKAMELVAGKPMVRLLQDNLFAPLGATSIMEPDLGYSESATAIDIAKIGQLLLNKGSYGYYRFFSEETYKKILPVKLAEYLRGYPDKNTEWGIGLSYMPDPDGPRDKGTLGPNVIGHGSASSSILRVDPDSGLVIVMGRYGVGDGAKHQEYRAKVMALVKASLVEK
jgi:CubicO group peptidase (beta-lactamase class C family)